MRRVEIVGADISSIDPSRIASQPKMVPYQRPDMPTSSTTNLIDSISTGLSSILGASKWGKKSGDVYYAQPTQAETPNWILPAGIAAGALILITAMKK